MVFSSFLFLFVFLPIFLACYFLTPARWKNLTAVLGSYLFYAWGAPKIFPLFFVSCVVDYFLGLAIGANADNPRRKKAFLLCSLVFNLGGLVYFKYANFFVGEFSRMLGVLGLGDVPWVSVVLPIGISFFTFHKISYIIDVYRGVVGPSKNFIDYALYIALFPQLIAGPIIRYHDINDQLVNRRHSLEMAFEGIYRFCLGLGKKVLIADVMGNVANNVMNLHAPQLSSTYAWLGIICYAYQIYFDFSGYSDMAIGLGKIMGFTFLENFDRPYISRNFTEFWRRWHISLSRWMRDYLYIPLGGNRVSTGRMYLNLWLVFFLSGLWHGANWTFIVWGLYQGFFLVMDRLFWLSFSKRFTRFTNTALTFGLVLFGWVFFRSDTLADALDYIWHMLNVFEYGTAVKYVVRGNIIHNEAIFVFAAATLICFVPSLPSAHNLLAAARGRLSLAQVACLKFSASAACLVLAALALSATNFTPFIYFRF